jgi:hypothetical protein
MSNSKNTYFENKDFVDRFIELCDTSKPAEVARFLDISYQASKNYLEGRLPETQTLIHIAEKTNCSIDWLLLGIGKKISKKNTGSDTLQVSDQLLAIIRKECEKVFAEYLDDQKETGKEKVFVLKRKDIKEEKVLDDTPKLPLNQD